MTMGEKILHLRTEKKISQEKLALDLGLSRQAVSKWETDQSTPDLDNLKIIADYFNVSVEDLVNDDVKSVNKTTNFKTNINKIKLISKISLLSLLGMTGSYFLIYLLILIFQNPIISFQQHYVNEHIFTIPFGPLVNILLHISFFVVMSILLLKRMHTKAKNHLFEFIAVFSIFELLAIDYSLSYLGSIFIPNSAELALSYHHVVSILNLPAPLLVTIKYLYVIGASLSLAGKMISNQEYKSSPISKSYRKWHNVIYFFSAFILGLMSLPMYISMLKDNKDNENYKINNSIVWYKFGLILNCALSIIVLIIIVIVSSLI